jgi:hypothetical protein
MFAMPSLAFAHPPLCPETWNPAEQPAKFTGVPGGWSTAPGTTNQATPVNPDGFFILNSDVPTVGSTVTLFDGCGCQAGFGGTEELEESGGGTCFEYGTFPTGTTIKYTEANGKDPAIEPMAANNGQGGGIATYIDWHLWGQGDLEVCNGVGCICCRVPPPPFSIEPAPERAIEPAPEPAL